MATRKSTAKTGTYADRLNVSKDAKEAANVARNVEQTSIQMQRDVFDAKNVVSQCESHVETLKNSFPFNSSAVIAAIDELNNAQSDLDTLVELQAELFPA